MALNWTSQAMEFNHRHGAVSKDTVRGKKRSRLRRETEEEEKKVKKKRTWFYVHINKTGLQINHLSQHLTPFVHLKGASTVR
jgi:hypothetical protein